LDACQRAASLEIWALFVVTAIAGSFATFFGSADP